MNFDVVIVGGGPAGLAAAIRLRQLAVEQNRDVTVCVVEKGSEIGAHILSGAVIEPSALDELIPDWKDKGAPLITPATSDRFLYLTETRAVPLPVPPQMKNQGNYVASLGNLCRWLGKQAEALGAEIYPGFAAAEILYDDTGKVCGVATGDMGRNKSGEPGPNFQAGVELRATYTFFAEGCRGSLTRELFKRFALDADCQPQTYGLGIKELWQVDEANHAPGSVLHTIGWPLDCKTYGGSFIYHLEAAQVAVGFVVGLDYQNPYLSPYHEMQRFKLHPAVRSLFVGGKRLAYGARALNEGGWQSIPKLSFPGGVLIGCGAGLLNVAKIKGVHTAMKSGMLAAEAAVKALSAGASVAVAELTDYAESLRKSSIDRELYKARNIRPAFRAGLAPGIFYSALDTYLLGGRAPWTFRHHADHEALRDAAGEKKIPYPKADGVVTFDRLTSVALANTNHADNQPCHLLLDDPSRALEVNFRRFAGPEERYCPAGVYEFLESGDNKEMRLQINSQNCIHCKACDIKDPTQNITWTVPEGGGGPNYPNM
ncbi:MAG TPA: electron transfer flavoprotein-ubiquinone oxidoreductase [Alphaproteobacteria bacterium]|nr:electron transfer flavoprotein-ubiquinone oxidoreductase [Alphaproteobacteria bacterium]